MGVGAAVVGLATGAGLVVVRTTVVRTTVVRTTMTCGATGFVELEVVVDAAAGFGLTGFSIIVETGALVDVSLMGAAEVAAGTTAGTSGCGTAVDGVDTAEVGVLAPDLVSVVSVKAATRSRAPTTVPAVQAASLFPLLNVGGWEETAKGWSDSVTLPVRPVNCPASRMTTVD
jgi:hypothetical protein